jgi:hypothetical protein
MLFQQKILDGLANGTVSLAFRRWRRPTVKQGGSLTTRIGVLAIGRIDAIDEASISDTDAIKAGYASRERLLTVLNRRKEGQLYRIELHLAGDDPRIALRQADSLNIEEIEAITAKLPCLDKASRHGPWTYETLEAIERNPAKRAADLAADFARIKADFKRDVRKLKALGLTESLEVGYRLSPRGVAYLNEMRESRS